MRWLIIFLGFCGVIVSFETISANSAFAAVALEKISHSITPEASEKLTFKLNGPVTPKVFMMKGDNPRLVVDFPNTSYTGKGTITPSGGKLALAIRTGIHQPPEQKVRVAVDLTKQGTVRFTSAFSESDNTLVVELFPEGAAPTQIQEATKTKQEPVANALKSGETEVKQPKAEVKTPEKEAIGPQVEAKEEKTTVESAKPAPPKDTTKKPATDNSAKQKTSATTAPATKPSTPSTSSAPTAGNDKETTNPRLLNVSFDDSSNKGEMVLFHLTEFHPPNVSAVEKESPKVVCEFSGLELAKGVEDVKAKGKYVEHVSILQQPKSNKIKVEISLAPNRDYDLQQVFFKKDNLFVLIINEMAPDKSPKK